VRKPSTALSAAACVPLGLLVVVSGAMAASSISLCISSKTARTSNRGNAQPTQKP
jgi:hypothetical protein